MAVPGRAVVPGGVEIATPLGQRRKFDVPHELPRSKLEGAEQEAGRRRDIGDLYPLRKGLAAVVGGEDPFLFGQRCTRARWVVDPKLQGRIIDRSIRTNTRLRSDVLVKTAALLLGVRIECEQDGFVRIGDRPAAGAVGRMRDRQTAVPGHDPGRRIKCRREVVPDVVEIARAAGRQCIFVALVSELVARRWWNGGGLT